MCSGARLQVVPNRKLQGVVVTGANLLPQRIIEDVFRDQYGQTLNFATFGESLRQLNQWYEDRDIFGQVCPWTLGVYPDNNHKSCCMLVLDLHVACKMSSTAGHL